MVTELAEGKSKNKTAWGWQRGCGSQQDFSKLNITPAKPKTLMSPAASEPRDKVELKVEKLGLLWWSSGYESEGSPPLVGKPRSHMSQGS